MPTAFSMIQTALVSIGEKRIGQGLSSPEQAHYLSKLNSMLDSWSLDRLLVYQILQESLALTAGTGTYTIGDGGAFNTTRPTRITSAFVRDSSNLDSEVRIIGYEPYDGLPLKTGTGNTYPQYLFYDTAYVAGLGTLRIYPEPSASLTLFINSWKQFSKFSTILTDVGFPPGYQLAIESNFTIHAAPGLKSLPPELLTVAQQSLAAIKKVNLPNPIMRMDVGIVHGRRASILTGP